MGLSSVSSGVPKLQPRGNSLRDDLVLTDGSLGLKANLEAGRFQTYPQYALRNSRGQPEPLEQAITSLFGKLIYLMTTVSRIKRPSWSGLASLKVRGKVKIMVTCVITGTISDSKGRLFIQVMETMPPYYLHKLTLTEANTVTTVTSYKAAFRSFKIDPARIVCQVGSQSEEEMSRRLDLSQEDYWFKLALSQQGLLIDYAEIVDSEEEGGLPSVDSGSETDAEADAVEGAIPKGKASKTEKRSPLATELAFQPLKMGISAPATVAGHEEKQKLKELQVLSSLKNLEGHQDIADSPGDSKSVDYETTQSPLGSPNGSLAGLSIFRWQGTEANGHQYSGIDGSTTVPLISNTLKKVNEGFSNLLLHTSSRVLTTKEYTMQNINSNFNCKETQLQRNARPVLLDSVKAATASTEVKFNASTAVTRAVEANSVDDATRATDPENAADDVKFQAKANADVKATVTNAKLNAVGANSVAAALDQAGLQIIEANFTEFKSVAVTQATGTEAVGSNSISAAALNQDGWHFIEANLAANKATAEANKATADAKAVAAEAAATAEATFKGDSALAVSDSIADAARATVD